LAKRGPDRVGFKGSGGPTSGGRKGGVTRGKADLRRDISHLLRNISEDGFYEICLGEKAELCGGKGEKRVHSLSILGGFPFKKKNDSRGGGKEGRLTSTSFFEREEKGMEFSKMFRGDLCISSEKRRCDD